MVFSSGPAPKSVAYPGFQRGGLLKVRPDMKSGGGGGGGGEGGAVRFSSFIVAFRFFAANY